MKLGRMTQSLRQNVSQSLIHIFSRMPSRWPEILLFWNHRFLEGVRILRAVVASPLTYRQHSERPVTCGELVTVQGLEPGLLTPSQSSFKNPKWLSFQVSSAPENWIEAWLLPSSSHRQLESLLPWILPAGSLVCFLILNRLDTLVTDLTGLGNRESVLQMEIQIQAQQEACACCLSLFCGERGGESKAWVAPAGRT